MRNELRTLSKSHLIRVIERATLKQCAAEAQTKSMARRFWSAVAAAAVAGGVLGLMIGAAL